MLTRSIATALVAASLVVTPATRAAADAGDVAAGLLLGILGTSAVKNNQKKKTTKKTYVASPARAQTREVQTSLNHFGFAAGSADGVMGRNTRNAISQYQVFMGYPATGQLTEYERSFLVSSYHRAVAGGPATAQMAAANPMGMRGVLKAFQQEAAGAALPGATMAAAPAAPVAPAAPSTTTIVVAPAAPVEAAPAQPGALPSFGSSGLPNFMASASGESLASHCNKVSLLTNSNGGFVTEASMTDPGLALNEQFCLARTYAISQGEDLIARIQGFTPDQIAAQCEALGPALKDQIAALSIKPRDEVLRDVSSFVLNSGMAPAELSGTAKICLSVGYRTDNLDVALASGLLLTVLGEPVYAELLGHHLNQGIGASKRSDLSLAWYDSALKAVDQGATPVFAPGQPERNGLIRKATLQMNGGGAAALPKTTPASQPVMIPNFSVEN